MSPKKADSAPHHRFHRFHRSTHALNQITIHPPTCGPSPPHTASRLRPAAHPISTSSNCIFHFATGTLFVRRQHFPPCFLCVLGDPPRFNSAFRPHCPLPTAP